MWWGSPGGWVVVCARWCPALPRPVGRSTMGAGVLSVRVRDGSGRVLPAMTTETCVGLCGALPPPGLPVVVGWWGCLGVWCRCRCCVVVCGCCACVGGLVVGRIVDAGGLRVVVWVVCCVGRLVPVSFDRCRSCTSGLSTQWSAGGLPHQLVCGDLVLKMVSRLDAFSGYPYPNVANQRCPGRDNWRTRGSSVPVLSY